MYMVDNFWSYFFCCSVVRNDEDIAREVLRPDFADSSTAYQRFPVLYIYTCIHVYIYGRIIHIYVYTYVYVYTYMYVYTRLEFAHPATAYHRFLVLCICLIYRCVYICIYIYMYLCTNICI